MKKRFAMILIGALALFLLTSCELMVPGPTERPSIGLPSEPVETGKPAPAETGEPVTTETPAPFPTVGPVPPSFVPAEYDPRYDDDPNFIFSFVSNMCATEDTFYFAYSDVKVGQYYEMICFLDKASGYVGPLCGKPECTHRDKNCNAYIEARSNSLSVYDGRLYWVEESMSGGFAYAICSTALDGTDRRLVRELDRELIQSGAIDGVFHRGWFYMAGEYQNVEDGIPNSYVYAVAWPLDPEEEAVVLFDMPMGMASTNYYIQGYGDSVYLLVQKPVEKELIIARWSPETRALETFYQGASPNYGGRYYVVREDGVYFIGDIIVGGPDETGFGRYRFVLYHYDFASGEFEENADFETPYTKYGINHTWLISDGLLVMAGSAGDGELTVMALDFEGNILLDQTYQLQTDFNYAYSYYCGRDETNLYLHRSKYKGPEMVIAVALDGSGARVLWDGDRGPH